MPKAKAKKKPTRTKAQTKRKQPVSSRPKPVSKPKPDKFSRQLLLLKLLAVFSPASSFLKSFGRINNQKHYTSISHKPCILKLKSILVYQYRLIIVGCMLIAGSVYALSLPGGKVTDFGSSILRLGPQVQAQEAPGRVTTYGPVQPDKQFSTYPTWSQDFSRYGSKSLDSRYWRINIGAPNNGNNEAEYYTNNLQNLRISRGSLILEATHQNEPNNYQYGSGRIDTKGKLSFLYGRIDVMAKLPAGVGTWPAVWLLPANTKYENMGPPNENYRFLNGGEIDMAEAVGLNPNIVYGVVHTITSNQNNPNSVGYYNQVLIPNNNLKYNLYSVLWTPDSITFEVNNKPYFTYTKQPGATYTTWPFNQPFYLIIDLAVGGVWGGEDTAQFPGNGIDNSALPAKLQIKSIYYYPYLAAKTN
jgi:beta-glucanase (GH16 family)